MPQHRKRRREHETHVMEDRPTITSATAAMQGGSENHGSDSETQAMTIGPTTTSVTSTLQGGIQVGNNNKSIYRNCVITNITNITHVTNKCKRCDPDTPRDLIPSSSEHTTTSVRLVDCVGREIQLGDLVTSEKMSSIYAGDGMIIGMDRKTGKIVLEPINVEGPFTSYSTRKPSPKYTPKQIVKRAKGKVGQRYDDGPIDFVVWCHTDMTLEEWSIRKGL